MKAMLPRKIHLNRFGLKAFYFRGPSGSNLQKYLSEPTVQPNTKVLLAKKGGERKHNEDRKMHHPGGYRRSCPRHVGLPQ